MGSVLGQSIFKWNASVFTCSFNCMLISSGSTEEAYFLKKEGREYEASLTIQIGQESTE